MKDKDKIKKYMKKQKNPYILKVGDMVVVMEYSEDNKTFNDCIYNILKQKMN